MMKSMKTKLAKYAYNESPARSQPPLKYETVLKRYSEKYSEANDSVALDLGCGLTPRNHFNCRNIYGVDIRETTEKNIMKCDLSVEELPFSANSFNVITAYDVLEHIPRVTVTERSTTFPFIRLMNEISRCLKDGGLFFSQTPCFPCKEAFQDPTHVNIMTEDTLRIYFSGEKPLAAMYGYTGTFEIVEQGWSGGHFLAVMIKKDFK